MKHNTQYNHTWLHTGNTFFSHPKFGNFDLYSITSIYVFLYIRTFDSCIFLTYHPKYVLGFDIHTLVNVLEFNLVIYILRSTYSSLIYVL
jgi:hypothetical protein